MTVKSILNYSLIALSAIVAGSIIVAGVYTDRLARIGAGYKAKISCTEIFLVGRNEEEVLTVDFADMPPILDRILVSVDHENKMTSAAGPLGFGRARALYREGYGCTLANGGRIAPLPAIEQATAHSSRTASDNTASQQTRFDRVDEAQIEKVISDALNNNDLNHRSIMVVVDGVVVAEGYAPGFSPETKMQSWSMAKSVTATLVGAAVRQGLIDIKDPAPVPEWRGDRARSNITWDDLLRMHSGLSFKEAYDKPRSDVNRMLFEAAETGAVAAKKSAPDAPGDVWYYSSGTTNIIARALKDVLEAAEIDFYQFARENIFDPIGAQSFVLEPDASGNFIGSSYAYATTRDWGRLGELYLARGKWDETQLLPESWSDYVSSVTKASDGQYGAHFWLNQDGADGRERFLPGAPTDLYMMSGHEGQYVMIVPRKNTIIVRAGLTRGKSPMPLVAPLIAEILDAIGDAPDQET